MFDKEILHKILGEYKSEFDITWWNDERYKWKAVKHFQDHWKDSCEDFSEMLKESLSRTYNLLSSAGNFPRGVINFYAEKSPEEVQNMFAELYDESSDVYERIEAFKHGAAEFKEKHEIDDKSHFQSENAISVYLWLRYPDKYYIYKFGEIKTVAEVLNSNYVFKKGKYKDNLRNFYAFYDELCDEIGKDKELVEMLKKKTAESDIYYEDSALKTLTTDIGFYISRRYGKKKIERTWLYEDYDSGISSEEWKEMMSDENVFDDASLKVINSLYDYGGEATCSQLAEEYGDSADMYRSVSTALAMRVAEKTGCPVPSDQDDNNKWWPVLYLGRNADKNEEGTFVWKMRNELKEAVELYRDESSEGESYDIYTKQDFLNEVFISEERYDKLKNILTRKKNIILQGAPGVGKTFAAKRLAYSVMGEKDDSRIEFVQFHQNYSYEDFMMGYRPSGEGFELQYGVFYRFCQKAAGRPDKDHFFIIDEINRGNMSRIFGELLMLIEKDYRGTKATMAYNGIPFAVPENLYIIGMMNTADRSLAMIDYALRRRFSFFEMEPGFDSEGFQMYQKSLKNETFDELITIVKQLNDEIRNDGSLGKGFCIGHSYFCGCEDSKECTDQWMQSIVEADIIPMLEEYWFDDEDKQKRWADILNGVFR